MKYKKILLFYSLFVYNYQCETIINNNLVSNNITITKTCKLNNGFFNNINFIGTNIDFYNNCVFDTILLQNIQNNTINSENIYWIMIDKNNILFALPLIMFDNKLLTKNLYGINNSLSFNTNSKTTGDIIFNALTQLSPSQGIILNNVILTGSKNNLILNNIICQNITSTNNNNEPTFSFQGNDIPLTITSPLINLATINNVKNISLTTKNGIYNLLGTVLTINNIPTIKNYEDNIFLIGFTSTNNNIFNAPSIITSNFTATNNLLIEFNTQMLIKAQKLKIITPILSIQTDLAKLNKITANNQDQNIYITNIFLPANGNLYANNLTITGTNLILNKIINTQGNSDITIEINANSILFNGAHNTKAFIVGTNILDTGSPIKELVLKKKNDTDDLLYCTGTSQKKYMRDITPLIITQEEFENAFEIESFNLINDENNILYHGLTIDTIEQSTLHDIVRYDDDERPLMYEEKDILAICWTQIPHIKSQINTIEKQLDNLIEEYKILLI